MKTKSEIQSEISRLKAIIAEKDQAKWEGVTLAATAVVVAAVAACAGFASGKLAAGIKPKHVCTIERAMREEGVSLESKHAYLRGKKEAYERWDRIQRDEFGPYIEICAEVAALAQKLDEKAKQPPYVDVGNVWTTTNVWWYYDNSFNPNQ